MKRKKALLIKLKFIFAGLFLTATTAFAQTAPAKETTPDLNGLFNPEVYLVAGIFMILLIAILVLTKTIVNICPVVSRVKKKSTAIILLLLLNASAFSQAEVEATKKASEFPEWVSNPNVYILGILFFIMLLTIYVLYIVNMQLIKALNPVTLEAKSETVQTVAVSVKKPTFLRRVYLRLVDSVPVAKEKDILLDHDYDGIKELDNNLPPWWIYGFYVTIIFAILYLLIYHVSDVGKLQAEEYKDELLLAQKQKEERMKASADNVNEENVVMLADAELIGKGKETFNKLCAACHLTSGGGQVGPNLTDEFWLHGGGIKNIFKTITYGVPNKGMISWKSQLSPKQMQQVASYILTLKGTNPPGAKEPQGEKWIEENVVPNDSIANINTDSAMVALTDTIKKLN